MTSDWVSQEESVHQGYVPPTITSKIRLAFHWRVGANHDPVKVIQTNYNINYPIEVREALVGAKTIEAKGLE